MGHDNFTERRKAVLEVKDMYSVALKKELAAKFGCSHSAIHSDFKAVNNQAKSYYRYDKQKTFDRSYQKPIIERDGYECQYCRCIFGRGFIVEHIIPIKRGGTNNPENLVIACFNCNVTKCNEIWVPKNFKEISINNESHYDFVISNASKDFRDANVFIRK